jgi:micrococcal nuclease|tara:strand:- start:1464 stop:1883 length:420 start_codon:yes stop_codon:yes gene_type:complete
MYEYRVKIVKVVDGDTVDVDIDLGFGVWLKKQRVRLFGIDTPESRTRDLVEKRFGNMAKDYLKSRLSSGAILGTRLDKKGKFGRILGEFFVLDNEGHPQFEVKVNVNEELIAKHHAVAYHGQSKEEIKEAHLVNRTFFE